jgi:hypothetical protein
MHQSYFCCDNIKVFAEEIIMMTTTTTIVIAVQLITIFAGYAVMLTELYDGFSRNK